MTHYPESIITLIKNLSRLPGIGNKTAERLALHILRASKAEAQQLARSILDLKEKVRLCTKCFSFSDNEICKICNDPSRDDRLVCVVEQQGDMAALEKSGSFKGVYHILQGALSPIDGIGPEDIRIDELLKRIRHDQVKEVIIATNTNVEGESTASYIADLLKEYSIAITRIASGIPMGGDLKYIDQVTLKRAMERRHAF